MWSIKASSTHEASFQIGSELSVYLRILSKLRKDIDTAHKKTCLPLAFQFPAGD